MKTNTEIRRQAQFALEGRWGFFVLATFGLSLATSLLNLPAAAYDAFHMLKTGSSQPTLVGHVWQILVILAMIPLTWSLNILALRNVRGENIEAGQLLDGFRRTNVITVTQILQGIITFVYMLLLIVPGIIKSLSYAMTSFVLFDTPLTHHAALRESERLMRGHKMQLCCLYLSFLPLALLCVLTLGIGFLWLSPYMQTALAIFYEEIRREQAEAEIEPEAEATSETEA